MLLAEEDYFNHSFESIKFLFNQPPNLKTYSSILIINPYVLLPVCLVMWYFS